MIEVLGDLDRQVMLISLVSFVQLISSGVTFSSLFFIFS